MFSKWQKQLTSVINENEIHSDSACHPFLKKPDNFTGHIGFGIITLLHLPLLPSPPSLQRPLEVGHCLTVLAWFLERKITTNKDGQSSIRSIQLACVAQLMSRFGGRQWESDDDCVFHGSFDLPFNGHCTGRFNSFICEISLSGGIQKNPWSKAKFSVRKCVGASESIWRSVPISYSVYTALIDKEDRAKECRREAELFLTFASLPW